MNIFFLPEKDSVKTQIFVGSVALMLDLKSVGYSQLITEINSFISPSNSKFWFKLKFESVIEILNLHTLKNRDEHPIYKITKQSYKNNKKNNKIFRFYRTCHTSMIRLHHRVPFSSYLIYIRVRYVFRYRTYDTMNMCEKLYF